VSEEYIPLLLLALAFLGRRPVAREEVPKVPELPTPTPAPTPTPPPEKPPIEECTTYHVKTVYVRGTRRLVLEGARIWRLYFVVRGYETVITDGERTLTITPPEPISYGGIIEYHPATGYIDYSPPKSYIELTLTSSEAHVDIHVNYYALSKVYYEDPYTVRAYEC
jgi:hypothetical protein